MNDYNDIKTKKSNKKHLLKFFLAVIFLIILSALIIFLLKVFLPIKIDLNDYLDISVEGYDGFGEAYINIDWNSIEDDYGDKIHYPFFLGKNTNESLNRIKPVDYCKNNIIAYADKDSGLSNRDYIYINVDIPDDINKIVHCEFAFNPISYHVNNLDEAILIDIFSVLDDSFLTFEGPNTKAISHIKYKNVSNPIYSDEHYVINFYNKEDEQYISVEKDKNVIKKLHFVLDNYESLSNGDVVHIGLDDNSFFIDNGFVLKETIIDVPVINLPEIITKSNQIYSEPIDNYISNYILEMNERFGYTPNTRHCYKNEKVLSVYIMTPKNQDNLDISPSILIDFTYQYEYPNSYTIDITDYPSFMILENAYIVNNDLHSENVIANYYHLYLTSTYKSLSLLMKDYESDYIFEIVY